MSSFWPTAGEPHGDESDCISLSAPRQEYAVDEASEEKVSQTIIKHGSREATLKKKIRRHLRTLGFQKSTDGTLEVEGRGKDVIRALHGPQREARLKANNEFLRQRAPSLIRHFAAGNAVRPSRISPYLERVSANTWQSDLFRFAYLTWSVPVSNGFGRRLRYLVWDKCNEKLIGLFAIGDPVFNLSVRDNLIGWNASDRGARLVNVMDAYVLGAVPPYNVLLGGKMVACLIRTRDVYDDFRRKYGGTTGIISQRNKRSRLLAVTTSSSMGRSSVYNRLKLDGIQYFHSVGYTGGWGHFHIPDDLFAELRAYLRQIGHPYADHHHFGEGPNWRLRTTRAALKELGFRDDLLRHGIRREVFLCQLASNTVELLRTGKGRPDLSTLVGVREVSRLARERWIVPRAERRPDYKDWTNADLARSFGNRGRIMQKSLFGHSGGLEFGQQR